MLGTKSPLQTHISCITGLLHPTTTLLAITSTKARLSPETGQNVSVDLIEVEAWRSWEEKNFRFEKRVLGRCTLRLLWEKQLHPLLKWRINTWIHVHLWSLREKPALMMASALTIYLMICRILDRVGDLDLSLVQQWGRHRFVGFWDLHN